MRKISPEIEWIVMHNGLTSNTCRDKDVREICRSGGLFVPFCSKSLGSANLLYNRYQYQPVIVG